MAENAIGMQQAEHLHQDNKELQQKLTETYESNITFLKEEIAYLKAALEKRS